MPKPSACPVCGSNKLTELFRVSSLFVSRQLIPGKATDRQKLCKTKIEQNWSGQYAGYYSCANCSFDFALPFQAADAELYSLIYYSEGHYPAIKWEFAITLNNIVSYIKKLSHQPKLIEIGAGNGSFLKLLLENTFSAEQIIATEYSEAGLKAIEGLGIRCFSRDLNNLTEQDIEDKFDIVCLFQVLEHMTDIHYFFEKLNHFTQTGARLYVSVPNYYHRRFFDRHGYYYDLPPVHVGRYNAKSLAALSEKHGWDILQHLVQTTTYSERVKKFLFSQFARWQHIFPSEKIKLKILKLFLRYTLYLLLFMVNIRVITGLRLSYLGTAQWFELERTK
ncbi:MAG: methyltransferase domain-containing protein [Bacteroidales bacterium]|nr:methyltransferase domain-containing protein [Bacteroidales bacterium]